MGRGAGPVCAVVALALLASLADAAPVRVRYPEGPARGFLALSDEKGTRLAYGELIQWLRGGAIASRLVFRFDDGSLYDEIVRFTQRPVFRVLSYGLVTRGPSFTETSDVAFDRTGRYRVRRRAKPGAEEEHAEGHVDLPDDVSNGMASTLLKNLMPSGSATTHMVVFRPKPLVLELHLTPEGTTPFWVGPASHAATRFLVKPEVTGLTGVVASLTGKQPPELRMWIAQGLAPALVKFEGPLYADGPSWHVELTGPQWSPSR